ncbi:MAG: HNH endonuclease [Verrucomicrobiales bacterium]|nr:HNH endonuclease [Verrucomicrobiales bacterium]
MNSRYPTAAQRAGHRCEYCRAPEAIFNFPFEVEHIVPTGRGGADDVSNWALSCRACNLHKGARLVAADPQTGAVVSLFNPREQRWEDHFRCDPNTAELVGITRIGRATVACLQMNRPAQSEARRQWVQLRIYPTL